MNRFINYVTVGYFFLVLYLAQEFADVRWVYLDDLQKDEIFKRWTGFALGLFMLGQWSLTIVRVVKRWNEYAFNFTQIHKWMGALSPLIFYVHAMRFGHAYLFFLAISFYSNLLLGLLNTEQLKVRANWYFQGWMIAHVAISMVLSLLMFYHAYIAFYYE